MSWKSVIVIFIIFFFTSAVAVNNDSSNAYVFLIGGATSIAVAFADAYGNSKVHEPKEYNIFSLSHYSHQKRICSN